MKPLYFDHNATSPVTKVHWERVWEEMGEFAGNSSSPHSLGRHAHVLMTEARRRVAAALAFDVSEIIFTSGGSEANTAATLGIIEEKCFSNPAEKKHVILSAFEHPCVWESARASQRAGEVEITELKPNSHGQIALSEIVGALRPETVLVSLMAANNETGSILPAQQFGDWLHAARWGTPEHAPPAGVDKSVLKSLHFHVDAVQVFGKLPLEQWTSKGFDSVAICAHKLGGLPGAGALALRRGRRLVPRVLGGPQEKSRRAGTENLPGVVSLGLVAEDVLQPHWKDDWHSVRENCNWLEQQLSSISALQPSQQRSVARLPNTLFYVVRDRESVDLVMELDMQGICVSTGSACSSGVSKPSRSLLALGFDESSAKNGLRISLGRHTSRGDVETLFQALEALILRSS